MPQWNTNHSHRRDKYVVKSKARRQEKVDSKWVLEWAELQNKIEDLRHELLCIDLDAEQVSGYCNYQYPDSYYIDQYLAARKIMNRLDQLNIELSLMEHPE
jgi:hypothetical protein